MATITDGSGRLRRTFFVGDRVRLKDDAPGDYAKVYDFDRNEIRTVTRIDQGPLGARLYVEGAPHMFYACHVSLAWNKPDERRAALLAAGHHL